MPAPYDSSWKGVVQALIDKGFGATSTQYDYSIQGAVRTLQSLPSGADSIYDYDWKGFIQALQGVGYGAGKTYDASISGAVRAIQNIDQSAGSIYDSNFRGLIDAITALVSNTITDWTNRVANNAGSVDPATQSLVQTYWENPINEAGLASRFLLCYLFVGTGVEIQRTPYKTVIPNANGQPYNCVSGDFTTNGFKGNGTSKYMDLMNGYGLADLGTSIDNFQFIVYGADLGGVGAATAATYVLMSATGPGPNRQMVYHESDLSYRFDADNSAASIAFLVTGVNNGLLIGQSPSPAEQRIILEGIPYTYDPSSSYRTGTLSTGQLLALAYNNAGPIVLYSPATLRLAAVTTRMTDAEIRLLREIIEQFQVRLGRSATGGSVKTLEVTTPVDYHIYQRNVTTNQGVIQIEGYYGGGVADDIEVQLNNGPWTKITSVKRTGVFKGAISAVGGEYTLKVRASKNPGTVITKNYIGVGDVFLVVGQSNAAGQFNNAQTYSGVFKARKLQKYRTWEDLTDPTGAFIAGGSVWPRLATLLMARTGVPVGFITTGVGSTALYNGAWNTTNGNVYDQAVYTANQTASGGILRIICIQGESDTGGTATRSQYNTAYIDLATKLKSNCNVIGGMIAVQIGTVGGSTAANIDAIRLAQSDAWNSGGVIAPGFPTYNRVLADNLHWTTDADAVVLAQLLDRAISKDCYGTTEGRAPRFLSATRSGANIDILLQDGVFPLTLGASPTTGFAVVDANGARTVNSVSVIANGIRLNCDAAITGVCTVSLGSGNSGAGNSILDSGTIAQYPIEPFVNQNVA